MVAEKLNLPIAGPWYQALYASGSTTAPRRIAMALGSLLSPIAESIAGALKRCGHECVALGDQPELVIANWWKDQMGALALPPDVPVVHWWVGSDTHRSTAHATGPRYNWVVTPWLARVLKRRVGVTARIVPLAPALEPQLLPQSPTRRVLAYVPTGAERGYRWEQIVEIARRCPSFEFSILRRGDAPPLENMVHLPSIKYENMPAVYANARILLRLTPSDGSSLSVMEALGFGRHAVWNWWAPGGTHVSTTSEAIEAIRRLIDAPPYAGGVASAREHRAQADHELSAAVDEVFS